jgi:alpha-methylacyl-CoA racemase
MADPQFRERGVFAEKLANEAGQVMTALPVPVAPQFRALRGQTGIAPALGAHNNELLP